jgi:hypothetical protein
MTAAKKGAKRRSVRRTSTALALDAIRMAQRAAWKLARIVMKEIARREKSL